MEVIEKTKSKSNKKLKLVSTEGSKPVVDVPKEDQSESQIQAFIKQNDKSIRAYLLKEFDMEEGDIKAIIRETAECVVMVRSPKEADPWGEDVQVIENCIKVSKPVSVIDVKIKDTKPIEKIEVAEVTVAPKKQTKKKQTETVTVTATIDEENQKKLEKVIESATDEVAQDLKTEKTLPKKNAKTKTTNKTPSKTKPTKEAKTEVKKVKVKETKKPTALKGKNKSEKVIAKVSVEDLKGLKGLDLWLKAGRVIKRTCGTGFIQIHDQETVMPVLFDHYHKKTELTDVPGKGNKQYGKKRLENYLKMIVEFFKANDLKL